MRWASCLVIALAFAVGGVAAADDGDRVAEKKRTAKKAKKRKAKKKKKKKKKATRANSTCYTELKSLGVKYSKTKRDKVEMAIEIESDLGGVTYKAYNKKPLVIDCALAVSLAKAGPYFTEQGITSATYSSAYSQRNLKSSGKPSSHWLGLALDVHEYHGDKIDTIKLKNDYEQGLGDDVDCIGKPLTDGGRVLKTVECQMVNSGWFRFVLDPDYDASHYNHFHIEARKWSVRTD
jgi:hypothetical protein